jgi:hypothetical protein
MDATPGPGAAEDPAPTVPYGHNVGRLIDDYRDFAIGGSRGAPGYTARMRNSDGSRHPGRTLSAGDLDGLAGQMDQERAAQRSAAPGAEQPAAAPGRPDDAQEGHATS